MKRSTCLLVFIAALPRKVYNKLFNILASRLESVRIEIDWVDARIINPANLRFEGAFSAGRGLWLQAIGPDSKIHIGADAMLSDWVHIGAVGTLRIGANALIGSKVIISDHSHGHGGAGFARERDVAPARRPLVSKGDISIGDNVWLGDNVVVLSGVNIGHGCVVGANSLVRSDLPPHTICAGNPARVLSSSLASAERDKTGHPSHQP